MAETLNENSKFLESESSGTLGPSEIIHDMKNSVNALKIIDRFTRKLAPYSLNYSVNSELIL